MDCRNRSSWKANRISMAVDPHPGWHPEMQKGLACWGGARNSFSHHSPLQNQEINSQRLPSVIMQYSGTYSKQSTYSAVSLLALLVADSIFNGVIGHLARDVFPQRSPCP